MFSEAFVDEQLLAFLLFVVVRRVMALAVFSEELQILKLVRAGSVGVVVYEHAVQELHEHFFLLGENIEVEDVEEEFRPNQICHDNLSFSVAVSAQCRVQLDLCM